MTCLWLLYTQKFLFLLTCLLRGMTVLEKEWTVWNRISTHMPLARHDIQFRQSCNACQISTHMPLARHDPKPLPLPKRPNRFLLTCLLRGMTNLLYYRKPIILISTHMPLARHDLSGFKYPTTYPFLLTCLLRGMTGTEVRVRVEFEISTHMPLARHDNLICLWIGKISNFYSHASCEAWQGNHMK